ncbi:MAG: toll/interleukin-1 receptor domain-containing protein [Pseudomonadota bacterium]
MQVFLHPDSDADRKAVADAAVALDAGTKLRETLPQTIQIQAGQKVTIRLIAPELAVDAPVVERRWGGQRLRAVFFCRFTGRSDVAYLRAEVLVDDMIVGRLLASVHCAEDPVGAGMTDARLTRYKKVFLSYTSSDRVRVLEQNQLLRSLGMDVFQDVASLNPGDDWHDRLFKEIDQSDLVLVFWSEAASKSDWVMKEAERALELRDSRDPARPDVMPVILEGPPVPKPREGRLKGIHFEDPLRALIHYHKQAQQQRQQQQPPDAQLEQAQRQQQQRPAPNPAPDT